jgi:NADH-quinone oxidoreductase subunit L
LKRVLAYSTVSQLGYMFMALGAGAAGAEAATFAVTAGMFHLFTHAFFKALLFLAAGSVMHAMGDVIDMRRFGGLRRALPITHWTFLCGAAALAGLPILSGFWSKDDILAALAAAAHDSPHPTFYFTIQILATVAALLTAFYTFRAYFKTFWGAERFPAEAGHHPHESPPVMAWPLRILAVGAVGIGLAVGPTHLFGDYLHHAHGLSAVESHGLHWSIMATSAVVAALGIALAWLLYVKAPGLSEQLATAMHRSYRLSLNKFYLDEIFSAMIVAPARGLAWLSDWFDRVVIDQLVDLIGSIPRGLSRVPMRFHNGLVSSYVLLMLSGAIVCVMAAIILVW